MRRAFATCLFLGIALLGFADSPASTTPGEDASIGVIVYAEGSEISILRGGTVVALDVEFGEAFGEPLFEGDQVSTADGTYAEIQLLTGRNIVKIAENTTFTVARLTGAGDSTLEVTYGRVRSVVRELAGTSRFQVRGLSAIAGVRGTDFGYDQVIDPVTGSLVTRIYCFEGELRVSPVARPDLEAVVGAGEMIEAEVQTRPEDVEVGLVSDPVVRYWQERPFVREPEPVESILDEFPELPAAASTTLGVMPSVLDPRPAEPDDRPAIVDQPEEPAPREQADVPEAPAVTVEPVAPDDDEVLDVDPYYEGDDVTEGGGAQRTLRIAGTSLVTVGFVADAAAVGLFCLGDAIAPGFTATYREAITPTAAGGVAAIGVGVLLLVIAGTVGP